MSHKHESSRAYRYNEWQLIYTETISLFKKRGKKKGCVKTCLECLKMNWSEVYSLAWRCLWPVEACSGEILRCWTEKARQRPFPHPRRCFCPHSHTRQMLSVQPKETFLGMTVRTLVSLPNSLDTRASPLFLGKSFCRTFPGHHSLCPQ